tara:strand:+ start:9941 stop:10396 length:456 start_codon:yes stop_codon:yes gene_type:complete
LDNTLATQETTTTSIDSRELALKICEWVHDKKGRNLRLYSVAEACSYADYIVICSGTSDRHISAMADDIKVSAKKFGRTLIGTEGANQGHWVLLDFGDLVVHLFYEPVREYYELDRLWSDHRVSTQDASKYDASAPVLEEDDDDDDDDDEY